MAALLGVFALYLRLHVIPAEEALLTKLFGKEYEDYKRTVPRFPGLSWGSTKELESATFEGNVKKR